MTWSLESTPGGGERAPTAWDRERLTLGVEEEFHLVDLETRRLTPRAGEVLDGLSGCTGTFAAELQQTTVETNTDVATTLDALRHNLVHLRAELVETSRALGIGVASAGTMPLSVPLSITETPRFRRMLADYQLLVREQMICGMQVHVGIGDRDIAARLIDRVSPWLPSLLALSCSSPFSHTGEDTGYASSRSLVWARWPTSGRAGAFESAREYDAHVQKLVGSGVISDRGMIYFDVRPSAHVPTIEMRVCDACPSVDTVVLIAALFRAVVSRELRRLEAGEPPVAISSPLHRAAMWRAARSGLEGELVESMDSSHPHAVPAAVHVRSVVNDLRPELEAYGDWDVVHELSEETLARGSAACRQREALRKRDEVTDVVDWILAETAGEPPRSFSGEYTPAPLLAGYGSDTYDEGILPDGRVRPAHADPIHALCSMNAFALRDGRLALDREKTAGGVKFRAREAARPGDFAVDFVPRVLTGEEWSRVQGATAQRARALDAFLRDIYGEAAIVRDGVLPAWLARRSPGYRDEATGLPKTTRRAHVSGFDIVRDKDGRWLVLEDNVRVPSGIAFAMENRRLLRAAFPSMFEDVVLLNPAEAPALLRNMLEESAPASAPDTPRLALLSEGPTDSAFFEHQTLAAAMGIPLVTPRDLYVEDGGLRRVVAGGADEAIDVVYLRMEDVVSHKGANGALLGPELVRAVRAEKLTLANALGNGVADDKAVYAFVPKFIEYYLGEHPLIEQVPTYQCADPEQRAHVLSRLDQLVVKPVDGYGGLGVVIGPRASDAELASARELIAEQPSRWIAQEVVSLSTHPTYERGKFRPRHIDLRVFVYYGKAPVVVPAPLTRVAPPGSMVVNSSRGGGAKDTWVLQ